MRKTVVSKEILIPFKLHYTFSNTKMVVPLKGVKKELIDLSYRNAKFYGLEKLKSKPKRTTINNTALLDRMSKAGIKSEAFFKYGMGMMDEVSKIQGELRFFQPSTDADFAYQKDLIAELEVFVYERAW